MKRQGHSLLLVMLIVVILTGAAALMTLRISGELHTRKSDEVRLQCLWLARSALDTGLSGSRVVETALGPAQVRVSGGSAVVELKGARATVQGDPWVERFEASP